MYENITVHPTKAMQDNMAADGERKQLQQLSVMYGSHFAMRRVLDASLCAQVQRPCGGRSSFFHLNHVLGRYDEIDTTDVLNDPYETPDMDREGQRARLERKLGMH